MSTIQNIDSPRPMNWKIALRMLAGAAVGAAFGFGVMQIASAFHVSAKAMTWADFLAIWIGITYLGIGLIMYGISFNRRELAQNLEGQSARLPATPAEVRSARLQSVTLILAGIMMLIPIFGMGSLATLPNVPALLFLAIAILFVLQTATNILLWRAADEFLRSQILLTCTITFAISQALLFLWAAAEHLHFAPQLSTWETFTLLMTLYIASGTYLAIRNRPGA